MSILSLSNELLNQIIYYIHNTQYLAALASVNHRFNTLTRPHLYRSVAFSSPEANHTSNNFQSFYNFTATIACNPTLARLVRSFTLDDECSRAVHEDVNNLLGALPALQVLFREIGEWKTLSPAAIARTLESSRQTLAELHITGEVTQGECYSHWETDGSVLDLSGFPALRTVEVHNRVLLQWRGNGDGNGNGSANEEMTSRLELYKRLPRTLESLDIFFDGGSCAFYLGESTLEGNVEVEMNWDWIVELAKRKATYLPRFSKLGIGEEHFVNALRDGAGILWRDDFPEEVKRTFEEAGVDYSGVSVHRHY